MKIVKARDKDMDDCIKIIEELDLTFLSGQDITKKFLSKYLKQKHFFLVAKENNNMLGFLIGEMLENNILMIWLLGTKQAYQGRGIGTKIMYNLEKRINKLTDKQINIILYGINELNVVNFYKKLGYIGDTECVELIKNLN